LLYAYGRPRYRGVEVVRATDPGPDSRHRAHGVLLSSPERVESEFGEIGQRSLANGLRLVGDYHSHPNGDGEPSSGDLKAWARTLLDHRLTYYVGLICTRGSGAFGWCSPDLHPWAVRTQGVGGVEILRARLID
jgi:proteasome lid subunit RPN8/RPN11